MTLTTETYGYPKWLTDARREAATLAEFISDHPIICVYCGEAGTHRDHIIPRAYSGDGLRSMVPTVPACESCNLTLSDALVVGITERCLHIEGRLRRKHGNLLAGRGISGDEIAQLKGELRKFAESRSFARQVLRQRLAILRLGGASCVDPSMFKD